MKILFAHKFFHPAGGPETVLFQSMEALQKMGHEVIPFSMRRPGNLTTPYSKYFVTEVDYHDQNGSFLRKLKMATSLVYSREAKRKMELLIREQKPDIAHLHNIYHQLSPSILLPLRKRNIPVVMTIHDFQLLCPNYTFMREEKPCEKCQGKYFYKAIQYKCVKDSYAKSAISALEMYVHKLNQTYIKTVDCFIALSRFTQEKLIQYGLPREKIAYLPNYVNVPTYKTPSAKERYILFVGQLSNKNGILELVKVMRNLPAVKLKVAGKGEQERLVQDFIRENKMENVELVGFLNAERLKKAISCCSFLVFPNNCYHNCPMSVLESFAHCKPVVGSNLGSVPELVEDEVTGVLFKPGNEKDLAEKIKCLYENPEMVKKMGRNARRKVEENYSAEKYYPKLLQIYEQLIEKRTKPHPSSPGKRTGEHTPVGESGLDK